MESDNRDIRYTFRVKKALSIAINELALDRGVKPGALIRSILVEYCQRHPLKGDTL